MNIGEKKILFTQIDEVVSISEYTKESPFSENGLMRWQDPAYLKWTQQGDTCEGGMGFEFYGNRNDVRKASYCYVVKPFTIGIGSFNIYDDDLLSQINRIVNDRIIKKLEGFDPFYEYKSCDIYNSIQTANSIWDSLTQEGKLKTEVRENSFTVYCLVGWEYCRGRIWENCRNHGRGGYNCYSFEDAVLPNSLSKARLIKRTRVPMCYIGGEVE